MFHQFVAVSVLLVIAYLLLKGTYTTTSSPLFSIIVYMIAMLCVYAVCRTGKPIICMSEETWEHAPGERLVVQGDSAWIVRCILGSQQQPLQQLPVALMAVEEQTPWCTSEMVRLQVCFGALVVN